MWASGQQAVTATRRCKSRDMKDDAQNTCETDGKVRLDENAVCDRCGKFGAYRLADRQLCPECYEGCGSCCPEFGKDDLWPS